MGDSRSRIRSEGCRVGRDEGFLRWSRWVDAWRRGGMGRSSNRSWRGDRSDRSDRGGNRGDFDRSFGVIWMYNGELFSRWRL